MTAVNRFVMYLIMFQTWHTGPVVRGGGTLQSWSSGSMKDVSFRHFRMEGGDNYLWITVADKADLPQ